MATVNQLRYIIVEKTDSHFYGPRGMQDHNICIKLDTIQLLATRNCVCVVDGVLTAVHCSEAGGKKPCLAAVSQ